VPCRDHWKDLAQNSLGSLLGDVGLLAAVIFISILPRLISGASVVTAGVLGCVAFAGTLA
jgi:hypothetical protein